MDEIDMGHESGNAMQTNRQVQFNLGTFNIPTIIGLLTILGVLWNISTQKAEFETKVTTRLDTIESARAAAKVETDSKFAAINAVIQPIPTLTYKVTTLEQANLATNARVDRQTDALSGLRDGIASLSTDLKVLTQRLELVVPFRKTELTPSLDGVPADLRRN